MKAAELETIGFSVRLALARIGWGNATACLLCLIGAAGWAWAIPHMRTQLDDQRQEVAKAEHRLQRSNEAMPSIAPSSDEQRFELFYATLGEKSAAEQQVKALFAIASRANLALDQAEYKSTLIKHGHFHTYQVLLPVKGSYGTIRQFCEETLLTLPFASLDELDFKREAIASRTVEAKLRLTLYLKDATSQEALFPPAAASKLVGPVADAEASQPLLHLKTRTAFIARQAADSTKTASLFGSQTWTPPPPPPSKPLPPPPPTAPPLPFTVLGKKIEDGVWEVYLARDEATYIVREHTVIEGTYRVDSIKPPTLLLTYLPLNQSQTLTIRGID